MLFPLCVSQPVVATESSVEVTFDGPTNAAVFLQIDSSTAPSMRDLLIDEVENGARHFPNTSCVEGKRYTLGGRILVSFRDSQMPGVHMSIMKQSPPPIDGSVWTSAELATARLALDEEITALRGNLAALAIDLGSEALGFSYNSGEHVAELGARRSDLDSKALLVANHIVVLSQCEAAIQRIDHRQYGSCEACEQPIGKARLKAIPRATLCIPCQQVSPTKEPPSSSRQSSAQSYSV